MNSSNQDRYAKESDDFSDFDDSYDPDYDDFQDDDDRREEKEEHQAEKSEHGGRTQLLTAIQVFSSLAILAAVLFLRMSRTGLYQTVRNWYLAAVNNSIISDEQVNQAKYTVVSLWNNLSSERTQKGAVPVSSSSGKTSSTPGKASASESRPVG